jgi:peptidyl-prolyl cis-trans isomerase B (cyclophilin B)
VPALGHQTLTITTDRGEIDVLMDLAVTPCTAASMAFLAKAGYFDATSCHRLVVEIFALQCGDPSGTGEGTPGYVFADENLRTGKLPAYRAGDVAMANAGPGTNGSQFFFVYADSVLQGDYALWGHVTKGLDIVAQIGAAGEDHAFANGAGGGHPKRPVKLLRVTAGPIA